MNSSGSNSADNVYTRIPASAKKLVQNLKEIVRNHSEDEIYAALKETNMDPDDALHKLMNQDTFHEVKRKRDKRKEIVSKIVSVEPKKSFIPGGFSNYSQNKVQHLQKSPRTDSTGLSRRQFINSREDGNHQVFRAVNQGQTQPKSRTGNAVPLRLAGMNGRRYRPRAQVTHKSWTRVSTSKNSKADGLKETGYPSREPDPLVKNSVPVNSTESSSIAIKQQVTHSFGRSKIDHNQQMYFSDKGGLVAPSSLKSNYSSNQSNGISEGKVTAGSRSEHLFLEQKKTTSNTSGTRLFHNYYKNRPSYQPQQQKTVGPKRAPGLEWKRKPISHVQNQGSLETPSVAEIEKSSSLLSPSAGNEVTIAATPNLERFQDDRPVIIPDHLQVPESESAGLNFGSFNTEFEVEFTTRLNLDDSKSRNVVVSSVTSEEVTEQLVEPGISEAPSLETQTPAQLTTTTSETFVTSDDAVLTVSTPIVRSSEISKSEFITQQGRQVSVIATEAGYQGIIPQLPYVSGDSQLQETSRLPSFVQPFTDPAPSYFNPVFRPGSDTDIRYQFVSSNGPSKFGGNVPLMNGQTLSSSQELSQNTGVPHTTLAMGQPSLPVHAYAAQPAGVTISPYATNVYGYQYLHPNYAYMHAPYQSSYSGNSAYPQPPVGSSFASSARGYPPVGTAAVKYPGPQYKLGTGNAPPHALVATGYGPFATNPSAFATMNTNVTAGNASSYDDMPGSQFKENSLYTSTHQMEGSTVWVQAPLSRDVSGMQTNSYYNVHNQGHNTGYSHSQPTHVHPAAGFASYAQSAPSPNNHQILQQPHAIGSVGTQAVIFPPHQRGQVNWTNNYSNLIRNQ